MKESNYKVNPEFVRNNSSEKIVRGLVEDLDKLSRTVNDLADEGHIKGGSLGAYGRLETEIESIQDMLKNSVQK